MDLILFELYYLIFCLLVFFITSVRTYLQILVYVELIWVSIVTLLAYCALTFFSITSLFIILAVLSFSAAEAAILVSIAYQST